MTTGTCFTSVKDVESLAELEFFIGDGGVAFAHFWATWCEPSKQMDEVFAQLAGDTPHAKFLRIEGEEQPEIAKVYGVSTVPFFLFFKDGVVVDKLEGANAPELAHKIAKVGGPLPASVLTLRDSASFGLSAAPAGLETAQNSHQANGNGSHAQEGGAKEGESPELTDSLKAELQSLITSKPVMVFIKGTVDEPRCGFSRKLIEALKEEQVGFGSFDILSNQSVRQGLKIFSNWPTFPQLYVNGELVGGSDIVLEMHKNGELKQSFANISSQEKSVSASENGVATDNGVSSPLSEAEEESILIERLKALINSKPVVLFMKGTPDEPQCGFSKKVVNALNETGVEYGSFNILSDEQVRQGLKKYSNWPTYPQLYVKGELLGGCDIILEMTQSGELKQTFADGGLLPKPSLEDRLKQLINSSETLLFMKGTRDEPKCGFSRKVVNALKEEGVQFGSFNILSDEEVRQGLKKFSNWPTYPQLYHKGELLGGCDIVLEMKSSGELKSTLAS